LKPATTYYWRVRAVSPFHSPWSETWSFSTLIGGENIAPVLTLPEAGSVTDIKPIFLWQPMPGADRYELMVSNETGFALPVIYLDRAQPIMTNAWHCDIDLEHNTTYFWKVRACTATNSGAWSAVILTTDCTISGPAAPTTLAFKRTATKDSGDRAPLYSVLSRPVSHRSLCSIIN
jgi:hypothetical protein